MSENRCSTHTSSPDSLGRIRQGPGACLLRISGAADQSR